jgi:hypothetical protein
MELRLSPSGPVVGNISGMPLRVAEDQVTAAVVVLTGAEVDVSASLRAELTGPFETDHKWSGECEFDIANGSTNVEAEVTLALQYAIDGGAWTTIQAASHKLAGSEEGASYRSVSVHLVPTAMASFTGLAADSETLAFRVTALMAAGEADQVSIDDSQAWLRLTEHSAA